MNRYALRIGAVGILAGTALLASLAVAVPIAREADTGRYPFGALVADANDPLADLRAQLAEAQKSAQDLLDLADAENRDLSEAEENSVADFLQSAESLKKRIETRERLAAVAPTGRVTSPNAANPRQASQPAPRPAAARGNPVHPQARDQRDGFQSFGHFAMTVFRAGRNQPGDDVARLLASAATYGNEGTGADGGFAVPPEFRRAIWEKTMAEENLLTRCDPNETGANSLTVPKDETAPWDTNNGIQVYWEAEGAPATASRPKLGTEQIRLSKLMGLVPVTEELLTDAPGLESWLRSKAPKKMAAKLNTAILRGTGVGQPLGILNAGCTVSVAKETSQPADSIWAANISRMWSRMYGPCRRNAIWLINQDIEPALEHMGFAPLGASAATVAAATTPMYIPPGGMSDSPYARLKGRPVIPIEACSTLGDQGDIILADMSQYMALTKAGEGVRTDVSMHLYFDQALTAFRFTFRVNGQPWWGSAIAPENGTLTRSCFVTLDERT